MGWIGEWRGGRIWKGDDGRKTYVIRRQVNGHRYEVSTKATSLKPAMEQLARFEANPAAYAPGPSVDERFTLTDKLIDEVVLVAEADGEVVETQRRKRRHLRWWKAQLGGRDLLHVDQRTVLKSLEGQASRAGRIASLASVYTFLAEHRQALKKTDAPTWGLRAPRSKAAQDSKSKVVSDANFEKALAHLSDRYKPILRVLYATGWHLSELSRFIAAGEVRELPEGRGDGMRFALFTPRHKNGGIHQSAVTPEVAELARQVRALGPFERGALHKAVRRACVEGKVKPAWNASWLRHTLATRAVMAGAPVNQVSAFLGHRDRATTMRFYATLAVVPRPLGA